MGNVNFVQQNTIHNNRLTLKLKCLIENVQSRTTMDFKGSHEPFFIPPSIYP